MLGGLRLQPRTDDKSSNDRERKNKSHKRKTVLQRTLVISLFVFLVAVMSYVNVTIKGDYSLYLGYYGSIMVLYLLGKMVLSFWYKPYVKDSVGNKRVSVIIPAYNEKPEAIITTVESVLNQEYPIHEIFIVDDGSKDLKGYHAAIELKEQFDMKREVAASTTETPQNDLSNVATKITVHRLEKNQGKRHAQIWAFERATGDILVTIDSDVYVYPDAIHELVKPFNDSEVMATTGHVNAKNKDENLFTKLIDMRYDNAFRVERSAQSVTGNILVCSGCFSAYRKEVILDNIEHYRNQMFLGEPVQFGDDRCLTNYAILKGKTVYQSTSKVITDVPSSVKKFIKQQIRWNKSFFRESLVALKIGFKKPRTLAWVVLELLLWLLFGFAIIFSVIFKSAVMGYLLGVYYLFYMAISAYARNVYYILSSPLMFLLAPVYGLIHVTLLFPLRLYALATLKQNGWGTR